MYDRMNVTWPMKEIKWMQRLSVMLESLKIFKGFFNEII